MPSVVVEVPEQYDSVSRSLQRSVIEHVRKITGLPVATNIQNSPQDTQVKQPGSEMGALDDFGGQVTFPTSDKITTVCREEFIQEATLTSVVRRPEHRTIFKDEALHVDIYPSYQWMLLTMDFEVRFKDRASANAWYSGFQRALSQRRAQQTHTVLYHYPVPAELLIILQEIYKLREASAGYGESLPEYVTSHSTPNLTSVVNQAGKNETVVVKETQHEIVGNFEFEAAVPTPEPGNQNGVHICSFTYTVEYQKPVSVVMHYPNTIHNQPMPSDMIQYDRAYDLDKLLAASGSLGYEAQRSMLRITGMYLKAGDGAHGLPIPSWDDWIPEYVHPGESIVFTGLVHVDSADPTEIMSLDQMGYYVIDEDFKAFLEEDPESLLRLRESPLKLYLYKGYVPLWGDVLNVSQTLTVSSVDALDPRGFYHVVMTLYYDLLGLSNTCKDRMRRHGAFTIKLLKCLSSKIEELGYLPKLQSNGELSLVEFNRALQFIHARKAQESGATYSGLKLVGACTVDARQEEQ